MTFVQCIALKPDNWTVEEDDEEFELNSDFMLTATSTAAPSDHSLRHVPYRHGVGGDDILIAEHDGMYPFLLPFHAPCFRVYQRQYNERGLVGDLLEDLWDLRDVNMLFLAVCWHTLTCLRLMATWKTFCSAVGAWT